MALAGLLHNSFDVFDVDVGDRMMRFVCLLAVHNLVVLYSICALNEAVKGNGATWVVLLEWFGMPSSIIPKVKSVSSKLTGCIK
jgi:hypothetical protein